MTHLLAALLAVESTNWYGPGSRGPAGEVGPYQITLAYWQDAKMDTGTHASCEDKSYAEEVMRRYWQRYCPVALRDRDYKTLSAVHHWGPKGKSMTHFADDYVLRVMNLIESNFK